VARVDADLRQLLNNLRPVPIDKGIEEGLHAIRARFAASYSA
jgi:signal transduction histidine kinase